MPNQDEPPDKFQISVGQVAASSLAAVSAAVVCSYFGVAGTVIGTAVASFVATVGSALYSYSLRRTRVRLRQLHRAGAASPPLAEVIKTARQQGRHLLDRVQWIALGIGTGAVFVLSIGVIAVIEDSTNLNGARLHHHHKKHPQTAPTTTATPTPSQTSTPSITPTSTARPSRTPSSSASPSVTPSGTPTPSATSTPAPTSTPSATATADASPS